MNKDRLDVIEYQIALLVRLTTALSPRFGNLDRSEYLLLSELEHAARWRSTCWQSICC